MVAVAAVAAVVAEDHLGLELKMAITATVEGLVVDLVVDPEADHLGQAHLTTTTVTNNQVWLLTILF